MLDANHHALAIDVHDAQVGHLGHAQPGGVHGHEQGTMLEVAGGLEQRTHLLGAEDLGQLVAGPLIQDLFDRPVLLEHLKKRKAHTVWLNAVQETWRSRVR